MTKREVISSIMYDLRMSTDIDFEVDETISANVCRVDTGYCISGCAPANGKLMEIEPIFCASAAEVRKAISGMGSVIVQM